jgi:hypothetical protein
MHLLSVFLACLLFNQIFLSFKTQAATADLSPKDEAVLIKILFKYNLKLNKKFIYQEIKVCCAQNTVFNIRRRR